MAEAISTRVTQDSVEGEVLTGNSGEDTQAVDRQRMWDTFGAEIKRDYL